MELSSHRAIGWRGSQAGTQRPGADASACIIAAMEERLNEGGPLAALEFLNERTHYRFTGIYRVEPPLLRNVFLVDRENPTLNVSGATSVLDGTYCSIVFTTSKPFATVDASRDTRLADHAARESVISYSGVVLRDAGGRPWGTLCHFDLRPRLLSRAESAALDAAGPVFMCWLREHALLAGEARS